LRSTIKLREVEESITDLTRIYKPAVADVDRFVKRFVRKYNVTKGYENELKQIVLNELKVLEQA
jgi:hypothetical protein